MSTQFAYTRDDSTFLRHWHGSLVFSAEIPVGDKVDAMTETPIDAPDDLIVVPADDPDNEPIATEVEAPVPAEESS